MSTMQPIVIIGSGLAGYTLAREIRKHDKDTSITIITSDNGVFYSKPNLSNALSLGKSPEQLATGTAEKMAADLNADIQTHRRVSAIKREQKIVVTDQGEVPYSKLVLALGADPFEHGLSGNGAAQVLSVNDLADYTTFRTALSGNKRVVVLGGGLIGCEFAHDLSHAGYSVDVIHLGPWPLERLVPKEIGEALADALARRSVRWHFNRRAVAVEREPMDLRVMLDNGEEIRGDVVLSAIGLKPRTTLANEAGIATKRGIVVDRQLLTGDRDIYAIGDCAEVEGHVLPFVQPLMQQARALAATLTGEPTHVSYPAMPVVVKTPSYPLAVLPPAPGIEGSWQVECGTGGICALHQGPSGALQGFALSGNRAAERSKLAQQAPALLA
jgi:rubredoxin-NAD+ reductase